MLVYWTSQRRAISQEQMLFTLTKGIFEMAKCFGSLLILIEKLALSAGSSKQGNAILAAVGSNCVDASILQPQEVK